ESCRGGGGGLGGHAGGDHVVLVPSGPQRVGDIVGGVGDAVGETAQHALGGLGGRVDAPGMRPDAVEHFVGQVQGLEQAQCADSVVGVEPVPVHEIGRAHV